MKKTVKFGSEMLLYVVGNIALAPIKFEKLVDICIMHTNK